MAFRLIDPTTFSLAFRITVVAVVARTPGVGAACAFELDAEAEADAGSTAMFYAPVAFNVYEVVLFITFAACLRRPWKRQSRNRQAGGCYGNPNTLTLVQ